MRIFRKETARKVPFIVITTLYAAVILLVIYGYIDDSISYSEELTPEEIAHVDSMRARMQNALQGSIVVGKNVHDETLIGSVSWVNEREFMVKFLGDFAIRRSFAHDNFFKDTKEIAYPRGSLR
jgi:hypothetical protein